jgi:sRNA-binding protein
MAKKKKMPQAEYDAAVELLFQLRARFPDVIGPVNRHFGRRPLKIGIHNDIAALLPEAQAQTIGLAMRLYTTHSGYRRALVEGAPRVDLNGTQVSSVTAEDAGRARELVERFMRRQAAKNPNKAKPAPVAKQTPPAGIASLRAAARARQSA